MSKAMDEWRFDTRAIHVSQDPDPVTGATVTPIYATSTYTQSLPGIHKGYEYGRGDNPNRSVLEEVVASLEHGEYAVTFASGMAACDAVFHQLPPGSHVIAGLDLYGGVWRLLNSVYADHGIETDYVDFSDPEAFLQYVRPTTKLVWLETPSNPMLHVVDLGAVIERAHNKGLRVAVDNTFASPYLQNPLDYGADFVVHSMTKYISGHSDVLGGVVIVGTEKDYRDLKWFQNAVGSVLGSFEAWLILRGLKTLAVRMSRHVDNALSLLEMLVKHPQIERVYYPGFNSLRESAIVKRQMRGSGAMISFVLRAYPGMTSIESVNAFLQRLTLFSLAESLGGVESLVNHPASMTHAAMPLVERERRGIVAGLIRLSVGIEDVDDLANDLTVALGQGG